MCNLENLKKLAEQGDASAQYELGVIYSEGRGVSQDYGKAREATVDIEKADVGSIIEFGDYPQDKQGRNAPIQW